MVGGQVDRWKDSGWVINGYVLAVVCYFNWVELLFFIKTLSFLKAKIFHILYAPPQYSA